MVEIAQHDLFKRCNYETRVNLLINEWQQSFNTGKVSEDQFHSMYRVTLEALFCHEWHSIPSGKRICLDNIVEQFQEIDDFSVRVLRLRKIIFNPWNSEFSKVLKGNATAVECCNLYGEEGAELWKIRLDRLIYDSKLDEAWILLNIFMYKIRTGNHSSEGVVDHVNNLSDAYWCLNERFEDVNGKSLLNEISITEKAAIVERLLKMDKNSLCWRYAREATIRVMHSIAEMIVKDCNLLVKFKAKSDQVVNQGLDTKTYCKLIKDTISFQNATGEDLLCRIRRLAPLPAPKCIYSCFIHALVILRQEPKDGSWQKYIKKALVGYILRDITGYMNEVEEMTTQQKPPCEIRHQEKLLSQRFLLLRILFWGEITKRELALTAFSLDPSEKFMRDLVYPYAQSLYGNLTLAEDVPLTEASSNRKRKIHVAVYTAPDAIFTENPDLDEETLTDLVTVIGNNRDSTLLWDLPWCQLYARCVRCIKNASQKHVKVPLNNLERDYSAGITIIPDEEFYEPGYYENGEIFEEPIWERKEESRSSDDGVILDNAKRIKKEIDGHEKNIHYFKKEKGNVPDKVSYAPLVSFAGSRSTFQNGLSRSSGDGVILDNAKRTKKEIDGHEKNIHYFKKEKDNVPDKGSYAPLVSFAGSRSTFQNGLSAQPSTSTTSISFSLAPEGTLPFWFNGT